MSSNLEGAPPEVPAAPEPPRDDAGRFAAPQPPVEQQQAAPVAPPVAPPPFSPDEANRFYADFYDQQRRPEAFLKAGRQYGYIPEGVESAEEVQRALAMYHEWKLAQQPQPPPQPGGMPAAPQTGGYQEPGYFDPDEFRTQTVADVISALDQRDQARVAQQDQQARVNALQSAVGAVVEAEGLNPAAHHMLLQNVALGIDSAVEQGQRVDFSVDALREYAGQTLSALRGLATAGEQAQTQEQIAQQRRMAPMTTTPTGPPQAGAPGGQRGMAGALARAQGSIAAERAGG